MAFLVQRNSVASASASSDPYALRDPNGSDRYVDAAAANDLGSGSLASPWKTITVARLQTLTAGQTLWLRQGTYNFVQAISGLADGTAQNRITIASYPFETATILGASDPNTMESQYALGSCSYWDLRRLNIQAVSWGILIGPRQWSLAESAVDNVRIIDCTGTKTQTGSTFTDNSGIIFVDYTSDYIEFVRNTFTGSGSTGLSNNALIWVDRIPHLKVIGNLLDNCNAPMYVKHNHNLTDSSQVDIQIYNNIFRRGNANDGRGIMLCCTFAVVRNNAFDNCKLDPSDDGGDQGTLYYRRGTISRNTFLSSDVSLYNNGLVSHDGWSLRDNLFQSSVLQDNPTGQNANQDFNTDTNYNTYGTGNAVTRNGSTRTLAQHKAAFSDQEQNSSAGSTTLVGSGTPGNTPSNWAVATGAAVGAGQSGITCGVDSTKLLTATA